MDEWMNGCAFGKNLVEQDRALQKMEMLVSNLYWRGKKSILPFEYGILANIKSTRNLLMDLKGEGYLYLLTSRMNSDGVENMFSCLRY